MVTGRVLLSDEDRALLLRVSSLLEELLETLDVLEDKEALKAIKEAEEDVKAGRVRGYSEFIEELKKLEKYARALFGIGHNPFKGSSRTQTVGGRV